MRPCDLLPPGHTKAEINECYNSLVNLSKSIDSCHMQRMTKIHIQCGMTQQKCLAEVELCQNNLLNLSVCTKNEAEEIVNSELLPLTEKLKSRFEEELEQMSRDFEELAKKNEGNCTDLYSYLQEAMDLWDVHQTELSQQEGEFQKTLKGCRWKQLKSIQKMEDQLDVILAQLRTASAEDKLKKCFENSLSTLNDIRAGYETLHQILMDKVAAYPEDILQKLISYSKSISQYFNVKEIFTQNLQGEIEFTFQDQEAESLEQQAEGIMQENKGEGKMKSSKQAKGETNTKKNEAEIAQGTKETKEKKDGESIPHGSEKPKLARQGAVVKSSKVKSSEIVPETFSTSGGHTYTVLGLEETGKADIPKTFLSKHQQKESLPRYLKHVVIEDTLFVELKKRIRLCFFEHLEKWFAESLSKSLVVVAAKKEKLNSDHELHLHGLQQRQENIETNIYNVRAVELLLHKECLECQSAEVAKALKKEKAEFQKFCQQQDNISKKLQSHICDMESVFLNAPMTEKLVSFNNNLHSELQNHLEMIQVSLRSYRNYLEEALGKLRVSNVDFLKGCRLFSEGGNFSPEEVKLFSKRLQEESKSIGAFERSVKTDMEKMESRCLEQATELINQAETKFHHLFMNRVFMEKSQRLLKNLQVQIRSEVAKSNLQAVTLNSCLKKLHEKIDACAHPTADKEALTAEELYDFAKVVSKELKKRSQYLDCLLVKEVSPHDNEDFTPLEPDERLQSPIPVATPTKQLREESKGLVMGLDPGKFPLINPSRTGKSALDDLSIRVIQNLLQIKPPKKFSSLSQRSYHRRSLGPAFPTSKRSSRPKASFEDARKASAAKITKKSSLNKEMPKRRVKKLSVTVVSDKRFQIFEEEPPESDTFKGIIMNILWTGNNSLISLAEEFYQEAEPQIMMPEDLPETLDDCAELLKQTLLLYQSQTDEYYNSCLTEFQDQVKLFEKEFPSVSQLAFERLLKEHKEKLSSSITQIRNRFNKQLEGWESVKAAHKNQLHPSLGHPDNLLQLDALCQEEIKRQKDQADGVHLYTQMLQDCAAECAQNFVSALAAFTENLLLELDESVTVDDIQPAKTDRPREKAPSLIHQKEAELPLEVCEVKELSERGSRTWPGIPMTTSTDNSDYIICKETASVTTAKTTLGHVAAVEARDAVYKRYKCDLEQQLAQMQEESRAQLLTVQRWEGWWKRSVQKIKQHYT
ncbi:globoside alpha-1,3-N-acetylgalactosaminyltransferase 1 isoform X3 [Apus apus]|uniref:globoside alpha-1,3-N-acetylgalactosaminyltransferase 1 isoform X3 n=1 Tax=Apus apus TaxID=8895 RepID=UPI0021F870CD|nr:globoside alpha-1,3-N-acetylgalactosaminyltransferase 1 isoform X3 [Apus apus]